MNLSLAQKIRNSDAPYIFYHTHQVTRDSLEEAIDWGKSMDLDVCVDEAGRPYIGHSREYYEKIVEPWDISMPLWEAVDLISKAHIPVIVDCKHQGAWRYVEEVIARIGPAKCLAHTFISEFYFPYVPHEYDVKCEWSPAEKLRGLKAKFPSLTTTASAKGLPDDLFLSDRYEELLRGIKRTLLAHQVDTVCLNISNDAFSDKALAFFLEDEIIPHIMIDKIDTSALSEVYIGETDDLSLASKSI